MPSHAVYLVSATRLHIPPWLRHIAAISARQRRESVKNSCEIKRHKILISQQAKSEARQNHTFQKRDTLPNQEKIVAGVPTGPEITMYISEAKTVTITNLASQETD